MEASATQEESVQSGLGRQDTDKREFDEGEQGRQVRHLSLSLCRRAQLLRSGFHSEQTAADLDPLTNTHFVFDELASWWYSREEPRQRGTSQ